MKKLFLSIIAIVAISASSVFGSYSATDIGQLVEPNQLKMEFGGVGALFGTDTIRAAVSLNNDSVAQYLSIGGTNGAENYTPTLGGSVYAGVGYKTPAFGAWLGYEFAYTEGDDLANSSWMTHTPHLQFTALDNNLRINIPVAIGMGVTTDKDMTPEPALSKGITALSTDVQIRYYTQIDYFTAIRLYVKYGQVDYSKAEDSYVASYKKASSFGIEGRFYFEIPTDGPVAITPLVKVKYNTVLGDVKVNTKDGKTDTQIKATDGYAFSDGVRGNEVVSDLYASFNFGLGAANDIVSVYTEPYIEYTTEFIKDGGSTKNDIGIGNYMEIYLYPIESLEVYLELDTSYQASGVFGLETGSGVRWYF